MGKKFCDVCEHLKDGVREVKEQYGHLDVCKDCINKANKERKMLEQKAKRKEKKARHG